MAGVNRLVKKYLPYLFIILGLVWVAIIFTGGASLLLWPAVTSLVSGALLVLRPEGRLSSALSRASALYCVLLAGYQVYVAIPLLGSVFSTIASYSLASFAIIALLYLVILYASFSGTSGELKQA